MDNVNDNAKAKIKGQEYPLKKIFSSDFEYHIPSYQRPYAWEEEQTAALFDDLYDFFQQDEDDNYFLGSVVLIKGEAASADVIDGQQRLTTLSILFAVMANMFEKTFGNMKNGAQIKEYIQQEGNEVEGLAAQPRLFLRARDQEFFNKYIQEVQLEQLEKVKPDMLDTDAQKHILENCKCLIKRFEAVFSTREELLKFSSFLVNKCYLVSVSTPNKDSAFRIFSVLNSRGLDLLPIDIIKSDTIGKLEQTDEEAYTKKWEDLENTIGRAGFNEVFTHIRTIFAKDRQKKTLLEEFSTFVSSVVSPKDLIDNYIEPYTNVYYHLKNCNYTSSKNAEAINDLLEWLNKINNYDWMPSAIKFMTDHKEDSEYILWFLERLERLASYLMITGRDVNNRMGRYKWVLIEMENRPDSSLENPITSIELTNWEKAQLLETLNGEIYTMPGYRKNYILQRLNSFVSDGSVKLNSSVFSIEHVLPQTPQKDSQWLEWWPEEEKRKYWVHRLANLVPLTRRHNSSASNYEFAVKKNKYFSSKKDVSSYALTTQVLKTVTWTPQVVEQRQKDMLDIFKDEWKLKNNPNENEIVLYKIAGRGGNGEGYAMPEEKFEVRKGSIISTETAVSKDGTKLWYIEQRNKLIDTGVIKDRVFQSDYIFESSSAAAAVILGRSANGKREWLTLDGRNIVQAGK